MRAHSRIRVASPPDPSGAGRQNVAPLEQPRSGTHASVIPPKQAYEGIRLLFKTRLAAVARTREEYGQVKDPATDVLMASAERWAEAVGWTPRAHRTREVHS